MKLLTKLALLLTIVAGFAACAEKEPEKKAKVEVEASVSEVTAESALLIVTLKNADRAVYLVEQSDATREAAREELPTGVEIEFDAQKSYSEPQQVEVRVGGLEAGATYAIKVVATNGDWTEECQTPLFETAAPEQSKASVVIDIQKVETDGVDAVVTATYADVVYFDIVEAAYFDENGGTLDSFLLNTHHECFFSPISRSEEPSVLNLPLYGYNPATDYVFIAYVTHNDSSKLFEASDVKRFTTLEAAGPVVEMSDIEITSIVGHAVEFSVTTRYIDDFGFVVVPAAEYVEMTAEQVIKSSLQFVWDDGNLSWEQEFTFPFSADTDASTPYVVVAAVVNDHSSLVKSLEFTTPKEEMTVEKVSFNPTRLHLTSSGSDHFLKMSNAMQELCIHLVSETFGGRYDNNDTDESRNFVAEGSYYKRLNNDGSYSTYDQLDTTIGNIDLYENVITGLWETYGSFSFAVPSGNNSWLTLEIELPSGATIEGIPARDPVEFNLNITKAEVEQDATSKAIWNLTLEQDANNTLTFKIKLDSSKYEYIPTGTYLNDGQGTPCLESCSMIVNNVATSLASSKVGISKLLVEHNPATGETFVSAKVYVKSGSAVVNIKRSGPFKLYEEVEQGLETVDESRNLMIWALWSSDTATWMLDWAGDSFYGNFYFVTGKNSPNYLPEGRYYLRTSAPADGSMWVDCTKSFVAKLRTSDQMKIKTDAEDAYIDVTVVEQDGTYLNTIKGTIYTTNGFYKINFDYGIERGPIY
ncbi:MAG: hypothetical protein J6V28_04405 [Tidjanibacter sp.]|nr:hypothetical protein [Tidjanibacter sp.]